MEHCRSPSHVELIWCLGLPNSRPIQIATAELQFLNQPWRWGIYDVFMGRTFIFAAVWKQRSIPLRFIYPTPMRQVRYMFCWAFCKYPCCLLFLAGSLPADCASLPVLSFLSCSSSIPPWGLAVFSPPCGPFVSPLWCIHWLRCTMVLCRRTFSCAFITSPCAAGNKHNDCINQATHGYTQGAGPRLQIFHLWNIRTILIHRQNSLGSVSLQVFLLWISQEWYCCLVDHLPSHSWSESDLPFHLWLKCISETTTVFTTVRWLVTERCWQ